MTIEHPRPGVTIIRPSYAGALTKRDTLNESGPECARVQAKVRAVRAKIAAVEAANTRAAKVRIPIDPTDPVALMKAIHSAGGTRIH